ncbi:nuclear transport factor 2 family protein [Dolichospermum sp. FACHB-1091]|uniref:nuclear transport factor 2 family protein n=1 Tax=Dolichospermum sp. FACHB-1091 TaxID=2692798 RepID=UPI001681C2A4|nr:nuclear transport factor 2 family protein [Dolichospermum sp. FACHB-1091]MBD2443225.1 nuclear transport factor 2 family protein [Dolichospermum sp. FACHB-1091]
MTKIIPLLMKRNKTLPLGFGLLSSLLAMGLSSHGQLAQAREPENAPSTLTKLLTQIDTAANQGNVKAVMQFYSPKFTHGDGLNHKGMEQALTGLWKQYPKLHYTTQLESWKSEGNTIIVETTTSISSLPASSNNNLTLQSTIKSRQKITGSKIVHQDILSERTQLTSGNKPPQVVIKLPQQVKIGEKYSFDAIVQEPLGEDFLLGTAIEEPIQANKFLKPTIANLEFLNAGGLFKIGRAPSTPGFQWISAVIRRGENMTIITQRLQVVKK